MERCGANARFMRLLCERSSSFGDGMCGMFPRRFCAGKPASIPS
mgnify:CR=1 FL=1